MFYKVKNVRPEKDYTLRVQFEDGEERDYDTKQLFERWPAFRELENVTGLFEQVKVDSGGYGISWNEDLDLGCNELREHGRIVDMD